MATQRFSRREFLKSSGALSGALVIGFWLPEMAGRRGALAAPPKANVPPNAFLRIDRSGAVTVLVKHLEFGQGVTTSLPMLVAEELECDWSKVRGDLAPAGPEYAHTMFGMQMTGGSSSVVDSWDQLRTVGAQARTMLVQAAAGQWKVKPADCRVDRGVVIGPGNRKLTYGQLAEAAMKLPVPEKVELKAAAGYKLLGKPTRRTDSMAKSDGTAEFGLDVKRRNLHTALVAHPPAFGATLGKLDADKVKGVPGVTHVVQLANGVAVVGTSYWAAKKGRDALVLEWDRPKDIAQVSSESFASKWREIAKTGAGRPARKAGNPEALKASAKTVSAEFEVPFLAHAAMEPLNCTVELGTNGAEIWVGSQFQTMDQAAAAKALGLAPEQVRLHTMLAGGGFGRRANPASDYVIEACEIARKVKVPVKVVWPREDDIRGGYYRPMYVHRVEAGLDAAGRISGWKHAIVGPSILAGTAFEAFMVKDGVDATSVEGVSDTPYDIPNMDVALHTVEAGVPVLWWRSVGHSHTAFVMETMIDDLAKQAGKDPLAFRRELLGKHPRVLRTLELAATRAGWGSTPPAGRARGIAVHESFGSVCAQVAEVSLRGKDIVVHKVVAAIDCGYAVNPLGVEAQVQSAVAFGLSAALFGEVTVKEGAVQQSNFHDYRVLRMNEMPQVEVHIVPGGEKPTGVGEPGVPPVAPAVANALFALTGKRVRKLPLASAQWA